ncbi:FUSC family protein [Roseibium sp.]|uniref:FUSC family protein n=1 Tax=Roseibium sp. TaxID=1936156 RepID=UPI003B50E9B4
MTANEGLRLRTALACWCAVLLALFLNLDNAWWAAISAFIVSGADRKTVVSKGALRVIGTVIGCAAAFYAATFFAGQYLTLSVLIIGSIVFGIYKRYTSPYSYAWTLACVTGTLVLFVSLQNPGETRAFAIDRCLEISTGVLAAMLVELLLNPRPISGEQDTIPADAETRRHAMEAAVFAGIIMVTILLLDRYFNLPSPIQIAVTATVMIPLQIGYGPKKAFDRLSGCLIGGSSGLAIVVFLPANLLVWSLFLIVGIFVFSRTHFSGQSNAYVGTQAVLAYLMTMVTGSGPPTTVEPVLDRLAGIFIGVVILVIGNLLARELGFGRSSEEATTLTKKPTTPA